MPPARRAGRGIPRLSRPTAVRWLPILLLLLSLGVAAAAIVQAQRAVRSHRATAEGLLRDYAAFAAWSYRQHMVERLTNAYHVALHQPFMASGRPAPTNAEELLAYAEGGSWKEECGCGGHYGAPYYFHLAPGDSVADFAGTPPAPHVRRWVADTVRADARTRYEAEWLFTMLSGRVDGEERHLVYTRSRDDGHVFGFEFQPARFVPLFETVMAGKPLLPALLMKGRANAELVSVRVLAPTGAVLFASEGDAGWALASSEALPGWMGNLEVRATVRPAIANSLIIGGLPRSRLPLLVGLLALSVALAAVALQQMRREAELARLRSDFVSSVSHELRTPLAQVRLFLETLRLRRYSTDEQREWILDNMERETTRLTSLVDNVLHFSRLERGGAGGNRETVALDEYLASVVSAFAPLAASRRVRLETRLEPGLRAPLHRESFRQVLLNLLDNAVKYGPLGQTVVVAAALEGERVRITVDDEGPGVEPRERERIWEPFRRGERAVGSVAVGSGIGLSVVREIVVWHQGSARVETGERGGARFVIELPGWREAVPTAARSEEPLQPVG